MTGRVQPDGGIGARHPVARATDIILAYFAGLLTLINPCVLPVLPIVLATALQTSPLGPTVLAGGMSLSFVTIGVGVVSFARGLRISSELVNQLGAVFMIGFGLVIVVRRLSAEFSQLTAAPAFHAEQKLDGINRMTLRGQLLGGVLLRAVWSPCVCPTQGVRLHWLHRAKTTVGQCLLCTAFHWGLPV